MTVSVIERQLSSQMDQDLLAELMALDELLAQQKVVVQQAIASAAEKKVKKEKKDKKKKKKKKDKTLDVSVQEAP
eukprot:scaffold10926_cov163-Amphora_coffeaeformis.AAC.1